MHGSDSLLVRTGDAAATGLGGTWLDKARLHLIRIVAGSIATLVEAMRQLAFQPLQLPADESSIHRILVFRIGNVGDVVAAVPALDAIRQRFPQAHIALLTSPGVHGAPGARELIREGSVVD